MRIEEATDRQAAGRPDEHAVIEVGGRTIAVDMQGYLADPADWSREVAEYMAQIDGVKLEEDHWILIDFLNRFYAEFEMAPELPILARNLCKDQHNCRWTRSYIKELFPGGAKTACRYAGLPMPVGRSCG